MQQVVLPIKDSAPDKGKTFDFSGGYKGENVTVLDDCKSSAFDLRAFFSVFDPYQYSLSNSRNYDKDWLSDYAFLTCSDSYGTWVNDLMLLSTNGEKYIMALVNLKRPIVESLFQITVKSLSHMTLSNR